MRITITPAKMALGDIVIAAHNARSVGDYTTATVIAISDEEVTLYRPYIHTGQTPLNSDGRKSVIAYIGTETYTLRRNDSTVFAVERSKYDAALREEESV